MSVAESLEVQVERLARFILAEISGEPSQSQGAVDTAIRLLRSCRAERDVALTRAEEALGALAACREALKAAGQGGHGHASGHRADCGPCRCLTASTLGREEAALIRAALRLRHGVPEMAEIQAVTEAACDLIATGRWTGGGA